MAALLPPKTDPNRPRCRVIGMSDKSGLSDIVGKRARRMCAVVTS